MSNEAHKGEAMKNITVVIAFVILGLSCVYLLYDYEVKRETIEKLIVSNDSIQQANEWLNVKLAFAENKSHFVDDSTEYKYSVLYFPSYTVSETLKVGDGLYEIRQTGVEKWIKCVSVGRKP